MLDASELNPSSIQSFKHLIRSFIYIRLRYYFSNGHMNLPFSFDEASVDL